MYRLHVIVSHTIGAGSVTFEDDDDGDQLKSDRLGDVDPLLLPVLDPFVAVGSHFIYARGSIAACSTSADFASMPFA